MNQGIGVRSIRELRPSSWVAARMRCGSAADIALRKNFETARVERAGGEVGVFDV